MSETENHGAASEQKNDGRSKRSSGKKGYIILVIVLVLGAIGVVAYLRLFRGESEATDDAAVSGNQAVIASQTLSQIVQLTAAEGDRVAQGEVVVRLDDSTLKAQENQSKLNVDYAAQNVELARIKVGQAQSDLDRATVQLRNKIIPQEQYDHLRQAYEAAQASYTIALTQEKLAAAQLETVKTNLAHTIIASPVDGVVAKKWAMPGDVVQPAQSIYTVYDLSRLWVEANFKETQLRSIRRGDSATITVDAFPGRTFAGRVESIGAATASAFALIPSDNASGNYTKVTQRVPVRISIDDDPPNAEGGERLLPGMSAEVSVRTGKE